jgi:hypothetical protein
MVIDVSSISKEFGGAQQIALDQLTQTQVDILKKNQDALKDMSVEDIARDQFTATQNLVLQVNEIGAMLKIQFAAAKGVTIDKADTYIQEVSKFLSDAKKGDKNNVATPLMNAIKSGDIGDVIKLSGMKVPEKPLNVDNKPTPQPTPPPTPPTQTNSNVPTTRSQTNLNLSLEVNQDIPSSYTYTIGGR